MRPCVSDPKLCDYHQLLDGTYSIDALADMHEALDEIEEYRRRAEARQTT
jgi:hypothetical protein